MSEIDEFEIAKEIRIKIKDLSFLKKELESEKIVQEILGFSETTMGKFYTAACSLFELQRYVEAGDAFLFLVTLNPYHYDYWLGFGAATQHLNHYEEAIDAYEMAAICQLECPVPYLHLAKCLFAMHDRSSALQAIDLALEYSENRDEYDDLHRQAKAAKEVLLKEE